MLFELSRYRGGARSVRGGVVQTLVAAVADGGQKRWQSRGGAGCRTAALEQGRGGER